jgi:hypothetical protein
MADAVDYYAVLGVAPSSDDVVIRAAYRALMLKYHPDTNADARSTLKAARINEAYKILSDASRRARYDEERSAAAEPFAASAAAEPLSVHNKSETRTRAIWAILGIIASVVIVSLGRQNGLAPVATKRSSPVIIQAASAVPPIETVQLAASPAASAANIPENELRPDLQSPTPVTFEDMEAAAVRFDRVLQRSGIIGAKAFSRACHRGFALHPNWTTADRCAAFDFAAADIDTSCSSRFAPCPMSRRHRRRLTTSTTGLSGEPKAINPRRLRPVGINRPMAPIRFRSFRSNGSAPAIREYSSGTPKGPMS